MANKEFIAQQLNRFFQIITQKVNLDESTAMEIADLYEPWEVNRAYGIGKIVKYGVNTDNETQLYIVIQAHTSEASWTPDKAKSLFKAIGFTPSGYPVWTQPLGASDAYMKDDIVNFEDALWVSICDFNVWQPGIYGWEKLFEN